MNFADILESHARRQPDHPAIVDGARVISYRELHRSVDGVAANLDAAGIAPGDVVAMMLSDSPEYLVVLLALVRAGAVMAAIDAELPAAEKGVAASVARAKIVIAETHEPAIGEAPVLPLAALWARPPQGYVRPTLEGDHPLMIVQSSGTTGQPKSFHWSHDAMRAQAIRHQRCLGWTPQDRYLAVVNMGFFWERELCLVLLSLGATVCINHATSVEAAIGDIRNGGITILALTPAHIVPLLEHRSDNLPMFPSVRTMIVGSAPLTHERRLQIRTRLTPHFYEQLGTNEAGLLVLGTPADQDTRPAAIGRVAAGVEAHVVDQAGRTLPPGEVGLAGFRGDGFPRAYVDNPAATARAFRDGWFYPGDLAAIDKQGYFHFKGRADDVINCQGVKFYPIEVEKALLAHPLVAEAAVFGWPHARYGEVAVAFVVGSGKLTQSELAHFCRQRVAAYKIPNRIVFVERLPRNSAGKIMKARLREAFRSVRT